MTVRIVLALASIAFCTLPAPAAAEPPEWITVDCRGIGRAAVAGPMTSRQTACPDEWALRVTPASRLAEAYLARGMAEEDVIARLDRANLTHVKAGHEPKREMRIGRLVLRFSDLALDEFEVQSPQQ